MAIDSVTLVGATGWLGRHIGTALLRHGILEPEQLTCVSRSEPPEHYREWPDVRWSSNVSASVTDADVVILSVHAAQFRAWSLPRVEALVMSLMAGVSVQELHGRTGSMRIVRAMPNSAVEIGRSYTPWIPSNPLTPHDEDAVRRILGTLGAEREVPDEHSLNVLTGLSGGGPAYTALLINALTCAGTELGLTQELAADAALSTVVDAGWMLSTAKVSPDHCIEQFLKYDGIIAEALRTALKSGFNNSVQQSLTASLARVKEMEAKAWMTVGQHLSWSFIRVSGNSHGAHRIGPIPSG